MNCGRSDGHPSIRRRAYNAARRLGEPTHLIFSRGNEREGAVAVYEEHTIESWSQFVEIVGSARYANWAFRGHSDARWPLESTLGRRFKAARIHKNAWSEQESRILRIFKRKAHLFLDHIPDDADSFRWLALMQHHGAPTRLLDFTWSPYVAAFFALENAMADAAIWAVNPTALNQPVRLKKNGKFARVDPRTLGPWQEGNYERHLLGNQHSFVVYGEPRIMNQRLIAQSGTFVIPATLEKSVEEILSSYRDPKNALVKFVLKSNALRDRAMLELYTMNVTYYSLFPGLDGLARSMGYESEYSWAFNPRTLERYPGH